MGTTNRKCKVCGKEFYFCPNCGNVKKPKWHANYCSENCKAIFDVAVRFNLGNISKEEASAILKECDVKFSDYPEDIQNVIRKIQKKDSFSKKESESKEGPANE